VADNRHGVVGSPPYVGIPDARLAVSRQPIRESSTSRCRASAAKLLPCP
jgi:hypothetical protein